jgi:hypothetical protein
VDKCAFLLNCQPAKAEKLRELVDLPDSIKIWVDNTGESGRAFGVERGWLPDKTDANPSLKLFGVYLWGFGAWAALPAIIGVCIGNPFTAQPWIEDAMTVGQRQGRGSNIALELDEDGSVKTNKFSELPLVGSWQKRPLELATLRLLRLCDGTAN